MLRVVDVLPERAELEATGLVEKNFRIHPEVYRHFVAQYRRDFPVFVRAFRKEACPADSAAAPVETHPAAAQDEECLAAFERSLPPFQYHRGGIYRYRIDRTGNAARPIILDSFERSEITGTHVIDRYTSEHGLMTWLVNRIEKWLIARQEKC
jgi:hypothetical protein